MLLNRGVVVYMVNIVPLQGSELSSILNDSTKNCFLAQLVEHSADNRKVTGSNPVETTISV